MIYTPFKSAEDFEKKIQFNETHESIFWDFKAKLNTQKLEQIAIDLAAFANTFGGTLLIGISEKNGIASGINPGIDFENIRKIIDGKVNGKIDKGFVLLVGFTFGDTKEIVDKMINKIINLRIFSDSDDRRCPCR